MNKPRTSFDRADHAERDKAIEISVDPLFAERGVASSPTQATIAAALQRITEADQLNGAEQIVASGTALVPEDLRDSGRTAIGHPGTEILRHAAAADHDLIVIGSRGRGAVSSAVLGSVSHFVLNHGTVPMLIVHGNGSSQPSDR